MFQERKYEITKKLEDTLKSTREYHDLKSLVYFKEKINPNREWFDEYVIITYENDSKALAKVSGDSGSALVKDIIKNLENFEAYKRLNESLTEHYKVDKPTPPIAQITFDEMTYVDVTACDVPEIIDLYFK